LVFSSYPNRNRNPNRLLQIHSPRSSPSQNSSFPPTNWALTPYGPTQPCALVLVGGCRSDGRLSSKPRRHGSWKGGRYQAFRVQGSFHPRSISIWISISISKNPRPLIPATYYKDGKTRSELNSDLIKFHVPISPVQTYETCYL
jgi:hypothetical protein